jgi:hypothetical protein
MRQLETLLHHRGRECRTLLHRYARRFPARPRTPAPVEDAVYVAGERAAYWCRPDTRPRAARREARLAKLARLRAVNFKCLTLFSPPAAYATFIASARLWRRLCLLRQLQSQRRTPPHLRRTHRRFTALHLFTIVLTMAAPTSTEPPHQPSPGISLPYLSSPQASLQPLLHKRAPLRPRSAPS